MSSVYAILWVASGWFCDCHVDAVADLALRKVQFCSFHESVYWADKAHPYRAESLMHAIKHVTDETGMGCVAIWDPICGIHRLPPDQSLVQATINHTRQYYSGVWSLSLRQIRPKPRGWFLE